MQKSQRNGSSIYSFNSQPKAYVHGSAVRLRLTVKRDANLFVAFGFFHDKKLIELGS